MSGPPPEMSRLVRRRGAVFWAACEAIIPSPGVTASERDSMIALSHHVLTEMTPFLRVSFTLGLALLEWASLFYRPLFTRFSQRSLAGRTRILTRWSNSRFSLLRELLKGLIGLSMLGYYSCPRLYEALGYDPAGHKADMIKARKDRYDLSVP